MMRLITILIYILGHNLFSQETTKFAKMTESKAKVDSLISEAKLVQKKEVQTFYSLSKQANELAIKLDYKLGLIDSEQFLCNYYTVTGNTEKAMSYGISSLKLATEIDDEIRMATSTKLLGSIFHYQADYPNAISYYQKALKLSESDLELHTDLIHNIALVYLETGKYQLALKEFNRSKETYEKLGLWQKLANNLTNIGLVYEKNNLLNLALTSYESALKIDQEYGFKLPEISLLNNIGWVYLRQNQFGKAEPYFQNALSQSKRYKQEYLTVTILEGLYTLKKETGKFKDGLVYHEQFKVAQDQLISTQRNKQITEMRTRFETERIEADNLILLREKDADDLKIMALSLIFAVSIILVSMLIYFYRAKVNANKILEKKVKERTIEIKNKNKKLNQLIKDLEFRNAEMERYTYAVSHDLKSPLITISGVMGLIERDLNIRGNELVKNRFNQVSSSVASMGEKLDELIEFTRIGSIVRKPEKVFLSEVIDLAILEMKKLIRDRKAVIHVDAKTFTVFTDPLRLREVFQNLIENAIIFCKKEPHIKIAAERNGYDVKLSVQDNGNGIDRRFLPKIFNMFERLDHTVEGSGMGLSLCKRIVETQGGKIWAESDGPDHGSTFFITLPKPIEP